MSSPYSFNAKVRMALVIRQKYFVLLVLWAVGCALVVRAEFIPPLNMGTRRLSFSA